MLSPILAFTAANPGQMGHLHMNCKPQTWWIDLIRCSGMIYDAEAVHRIRQKYNIKIIPGYKKNLLVIRWKQT